MDLDLLIVLVLYFKRGFRSIRGSLIMCHTDDRETVKRGYLAPYVTKQQRKDRPCA